MSRGNWESMTSHDKWIECKHVNVQLFEQQLISLSVTSRKKQFVFSIFHPFSLSLSRYLSLSLFLCFTLALTRQISILLFFPVLFPSLSSSFCLFFSFPLFYLLPKSPNEYIWWIHSAKSAVYLLRTCHDFIVIQHVSIVVSGTFFSWSKAIVVCQQLEISLFRCATCGDFPKCWP